MPRPDLDHRRARRRLAGGSVVVQRGDRGAGGGGEHDPADFRGRPRDRCDADRFCRRPARADADRGRRNGRAGARRTDGTTRRSRRAQARLLAARRRPAPQGTAVCCRARCRRSTNCWRSRASGSTPAPAACRARCAPMRRSIIRISRAWPHACRRGCFGSALTACKEIIVWRSANARGVRAAFSATGALSACAAPGNCSTAYSYRGVLGAGFALVRDGDGHPLRSAAASPAACGSISNLPTAAWARRLTAKPATSTPADQGQSRDARRRAGSGGQGSLFGSSTRVSLGRPNDYVGPVARPANGGRFCSIATIALRR